MPGLADDTAAFFHGSRSAPERQTRAPRRLTLADRKRGAVLKDHYPDEPPTPECDVSWPLGKGEILPRAPGIIPGLDPDCLARSATARRPDQALAPPRHDGCVPSRGRACDDGLRAGSPAFFEEPMTDEDLRAELERLRAENERLKSPRGRVSLKVSPKGGVSVYGLGRFPVTLYKEQWTKLLAMADEIRAFLKEHDSELKAKPEA